MDRIIQSPGKYIQGADVINRLLFLSVAALCYILGQLGFISWVPDFSLLALCGHE
ncbi:hypothetical protein O5833_27145, partial [Escherichia coli]|nr:hypothetical protein [Escherichia coli]